MGGIEDGPFGTHAEVGVGFSDAALLAISIAGFCFLGFTVFSIIMLRLKTRDEIEKEEEETDTSDDYEGRLVRADVANLSRAERRARARAIMKQQRRVQAPRPANQQQQQEQGEGDDPQENRDEQQALAQLPGAGDDNDSGDDSDDAGPRLSRKERQRLAKAVEKEERKLMEDVRRKHQKEVEEAARKEKREREKRHAAEVEQERRNQKLRKEEAEKKRLLEWSAFLSSESCLLSVEDWIQELQTINRAVSIDGISNRFQVSSERVVQRIEQLIEERRVAGVISGDGLFIYISDSELEQIAEQVRQKEVASCSDVVYICNSVVAKALTVSA